jgi:hypothetical protein
MLVVVVLVLALVALPSVSAQCFGPDLLDLGPCCGPAALNLPAFPNVAIQGLGVCWNACTVASQRDLRVRWTPPSQPFCGEYVTQLTVDDAITGAAVLSGLLTLDYTRTWTEFDTLGNPQQVWRFAAKADVSAVVGGLIHPCLIPACIQPLGPHNTAYYYGYVDYTICTAAAGWQNALVLYHACDRFVHTPGFSDRPGVFHPSGSYAIVAPHSTLQPFVPSNNIAPGGPLLAEATRNVDTTSVPPAPCRVEDKVAIGSLTPLGAGCLCTMTTLPKQQTVREFKGSTTCLNAIGIPGAWTSLNILFPTLPWYHLVSTSIGCWTNPTVYPGAECAWVDEGLFVVQDACSGDFVELKYGGSTAKGWPGVLPSGVTTMNFLDLTDNYTAPLGGPHPLPIIGSVRPTDHQIYVNEP